MDQMSYILFICIAVPLMLMLLPIEKKSRKVILALLAGMFGCLFISEVNGLLLNLTGTTLTFFTINVTPITEEIIKIIPIMCYAAVFSDDQKSILTVAFAVGVGFALLENAIILTQHISSVNIFFAIIRGFSSGEMHSLCVVFASSFMTFIYKKKKIYLCGTICTFNLAVVYHSIFNQLVEASSKTANVIGYIMPIATYVILNGFFYVKKYKNKDKTEIKIEKED